MTRIELLSGVFGDLTRIVDHLQRHEVEHARARGGEIISAIQVLADNPLIGRQTDKGKRELVIGRGSHGYVALYQYVAVMDVVLVFAVRAQREGGYARNE